jgi:hypothetical protein
MIVRLHAIGSGMIVDPDGYIMTNATSWQGHRGYVLSCQLRRLLSMTCPVPGRCRCWTPR